jgi:shikimate kinase
VALKVDKPIVLVGMMGSGKSTVGRKLARKLGLPFYDSDKVIEDREGLSVVDIFDFRGEKYFRDKERQVIAEILSYGVVVLSTGGGSFIDEEIRKLIADKAISIWLSADLDTLYQRTARRNTRPELNQGNKLEILEDMIEERYPIYSQSNITVKTENTEAHYILDSILVRLRKYLEQPNVI